MLIDYAARHVFTRGFLARVQTIHFAFWAFLDDKRRLVFTSNYDGGHEAYMDDFINKAAWGLNLTFSHGVGWPRTRWLVARGARIENKFKNYQRRHQLPTAGLVQGLSGPHPRRPQAQPAHQGRARAGTRHRRAGRGLAAAAMSTSVSEARPVELDDVQGLVRFGYKHLTEASFLLLRVKDAAAARAWLARAPVTSAVSADPLPQTALHVAFTSEGLRALDVAPDLCAEFSAEFVAGMASDAARARRLGDVGANDPRGWRWGIGARTPHVAVLLYAAPGGLAAWERDVEAQCAAGFERIERLSTSPTQLMEPFGFADGISQPKVDWERERPLGDHDRLDYDNLVCLGEFLLGYPNEYGLYTPRPLLAPQRDPGRLLPRAEDAPEQADLGRNGCYLVLRQLQQDVQGFWRELDRQAGGDADLRERLAAAMVGRKKNGEPPLRRFDAAS